MKEKIVIFWFRRDLRLDDNVGLMYALNSGFPVLPIFIFDKQILGKLQNKSDRRVDYIQQSLCRINNELHIHQSTLKTYFGTPLDIYRMVLEEYDVQAVYCNRDYEPQAIARDLEIKRFLADNNIDFFDFKDQVIFDRSEVVKSDGLPYTVYTPYSKLWKSLLRPEYYALATLPLQHFYTCLPASVHSLEEIGFRKTDTIFPIPELDASIINNYDKFRDFPALNHTTHLGTALRFGTISIRKCVRFALKYNQTWLNELIWREFFMQILYHFPNVVTTSFKVRYDFIEWRNNEEEFQRWCEGKTGYPIVDAGMRELNETGFMHNRVRMIVASFLCKHLLIDWRWGEAYFAEKLNDYDLSANNGNWQWAAGCGCDAAPYFRIFNPTAQTLKFDKDLKYIRKWNPDFDSDLTLPIVDHNEARVRALEVYKRAVGK